MVSTIAWVLGGVVTIVVIGMVLYFRAVRRAFSRME